MYVDSFTVHRPNGKRYTRHLLRSSYREGGKVRHRTVASLSSCSEEELLAIRVGLKHKKQVAVNLDLPPKKFLRSGVK